MSVLFTAGRGVLDNLGGFRVDVSDVLVDWLSFEDDESFLLGLVGVLGGSDDLPAAGDGAILLDVFAVCGVVELLLFALPGGEDRLGVGGKE